jgi:hypothetical protein
MLILFKRSVKGVGVVGRTFRVTGIRYRQRGDKVDRVKNVGGGIVVSDVPSNQDQVSS